MHTRDTPGCHRCPSPGYVMVSVMTRLMGATGMSPRRALRDFCTQRPPGIYKDDYINQLFR